MSDKGAHMFDVKKKRSAAMTDFCQRDTRAHDAILIVQNRRATSMR